MSPRLAPEQLPDQSATGQDRRPRWESEHWHVFPVGPDKAPLVKWKTSATNDPTMVATWQKRYPDSNLGIACGPSGLLVIDADAPGEFERFCEAHGQLVPRTFSVSTAKGRHWYFRRANDVGNAVRLQGFELDVRAVGGYVVAPGSVHRTGVVYEPMDSLAPILDAPAWLIDALRAGGTRRGAGVVHRNPVAAVSPEVFDRGPQYIRAAVRSELARLVALHGAWMPGAGWDDTTHRVACSLFELANTPGAGLSTAEAEALVEEHAPTDAEWTIEDVRRKIAAAHQTIGSKVRRNLPLDVVSEMQVSVAPDAAAYERAMWDYAEHQCDEPPTRYSVKRQIRLGLRDLRDLASSRETRSEKREIRLVNLADVTYTATEWAWADMIPLGTLTGIAGMAGIGKSTLVSYVTAGITRGTFDGDLSGRASSVLIVAGEDDIARQLAPRLSVAGADLSRVNVVQPTTHLGDGQSVDTVMQLSTDLPEIRRQLIATRARLLILDPILSFVDGSPNDQADVRRALDPIAAIARELNIAVIVVMHFKKGHGVAGEKVSGSHVWRDALRSLLVMAIDEESQYRVVTVDKSNYSDARGRSLLFEVTGASVAGVDSKGTVRDQFVSKARYMGESPRSVQDLLETENAKRDGRRVPDADTADVIDWIWAQPAAVPWVEIARRQGLDPNDKDSTTQKALSALNRKLGRACDRGEIEKASRGLYRKPAGLQPLHGFGAEESF